MFRGINVSLWKAERTWTAVVAASESVWMVISALFSPSKPQLCRSTSQDPTPKEPVLTLDADVWDRKSAHPHQHRVSATFNSDCCRHRKAQEQRTDRSEGSEEEFWEQRREGMKAATYFSLNVTSEHKRRLNWRTWTLEKDFCWVVFLFFLTKL